MNVVFSTPSDSVPFELLDVLVQNRSDQTASQSLLSLHFLGRRGPQTDRLRLPLLTWFDANCLHQFTRQLANLDPADRNAYQMDLPDAGLRLTASGKTRRSIRVEPLPGAGLLPGKHRRFAPLEINGTATSLHAYARMLYTRLWDAFCRG